MQLNNLEREIQVRCISCGLTLIMLSAISSATSFPSSQVSEAVVEVVDDEAELLPKAGFFKEELQSEPAYKTAKHREEDSFDTYLMYVDKSAVYYRSQPHISEETALGLLSKGEEVGVIDKVNNWCKCVVDDEVVYIYAELLAEECTEDEIVEVNTFTASVDDGTTLTADAGRIVGPSGEETYYNLNMKNCVSRMHDLGYSGEYWIRDDGVKMFGNYVMVAANFDIRPLGTVIETSLGLGCVVDTGDFVESDPTAIDIAVAW